MNESNCESKSEKGNDQGRADALMDKRLRQLYQESEIVKMNGLKSFMGMGPDTDAVKDADLAKSAQLVLKCIEIQLRILGEGGGEREARLPGPAKLWEVLSGLPETGPYFQRGKFREQLVARLRSAAEAEEVGR